MPRYFFPVTDGVRAIEDEIGIVLPNDGAARREAESIAAELRRPGEAEGVRDWSGWRIVVRDGDDRVVCEVPVAGASV